MASGRRKSVVGAADAHQEPIAKKQKVVRVPMLDKKCNVIAEGINQATHLPCDVRNMLCASIKPCFVTIAPERHEYSKQLISYMKATLESVRSALNDEVADVGSQEAREIDKLRLHQNDLLVAKMTGVEKKHAMEDAKKALQDAKDVHEAAKKALKNAEASLRKADSNRVESASKKVAFESGLELVTQLRAGSEESHDKLNADIKTVVKIAKEAALDPTMVDMVPTTLRKPASERTSFDNIVIGSFEDAMKNYFVAMSAAAELCETGRAEVEEGLVKAQEVVDAAPKNEEACKEELTKKQDEHTDMEVNIEQLDCDVKSSFLLLKQLGASLVALRKDLDHLKKGPLAAFEDLEVFDGTGTKSQYKQIQGVRYERELLDLTTDVDVVTMDLAEKLFVAAMDGNVITATEKRTLRYIMSNVALAEGVQMYLTTKMSDTWYQTIDGVRYERQLLKMAVDAKQPLTMESAQAMLECAKDGNKVTHTESQTLQYIVKQYECEDGVKDFMQEALSKVEKIKED